MLLGLMVGFKARAVERIKNWLSPPEFLQELEEAQALRDEDTAYWLFDEPIFKAWREFDCLSAPSLAEGKTDRRTLWVYGTLSCYYKDC
jgi:hypothetical protein